MKQIIGIVVNTKMPKTAVVEVTHRWTHPMYGKIITKRKKFLVHNELALKAGDKVVISETKPISKRKKWQVVKKI